MSKTPKITISSQEVRNTFLKYFEKNKHSIVSSSKLIPEGDNTLLFTNAGMNQFKNVFLGFEKRDYNRATTSQKCVRAGGKHNDLEQVGLTARHHTFFEMLGNFSFGDYFKKDAIHFAWELLTKEFQLPKDKLYITVFETDDEAADIWHKQEGVPRDRIHRLGEKDNFWRMGDTGPCGPCTEIFYDHGPSAGATGNPNAKFGEDDQRFVEIWNLVFMQFNEDANGLTPLPKPSVDTGSGLERLTAALNGVYMNYDTDLFLPLINRAAGIAKTEYYENSKNDTALRVIADHARAAAFLIADGVLPSNEGRGYVLRRIMRRAIRFGRNLSLENSIYPAVVSEVISHMGGVYPELKATQGLITKTIQSEEDSFLQTLDKGTEILNEEIKKQKSKGSKGLPGDFVFKLYDTFGFPVDLTRLMSAEQDMKVDETEFEQKMNEARKRSQASWKGQNIGTEQGHLIEISQKVPKTLFEGYTTQKVTAKILALSNGQKAIQTLKAGEKGLLAVDRTSFYAEGGGQVGDQGTAYTNSAQMNVFDCTKLNDVFFHHGEMTSGQISVGDEIQLEVNASTRRDTIANHSATHLMHWALRKVLGDHITQAGSLVEPDRLRFDFTNDKPLTEAEIEKIEQLVNHEIGLAHAVQPKVCSFKQAVADGALALFGEKYGDEVRFLTIGPSKELCGGTHVSNTAQIRLFKIVSETGVSRGVRRIEALTGSRALEYLMRTNKIYTTTAEFLHVNTSYDKILNNKEVFKDPVVNKIEMYQLEIRSLKNQMQNLKSQNLDADSYISNGRKFSDGTLVYAHIDTDDRKVLSDLSDKIKDKLGAGIIIVSGNSPAGCPLIVSVTKNITQKYNAGKILQEFASKLGGKGGGRPDFAQGSIPTLQGLDKHIQSLLN